MNEDKIGAVVVRLGEIDGRSVVVVNLEHQDAWLSILQTRWLIDRLRDFVDEATFEGASCGAADL